MIISYGIFSIEFNFNRIDFKKKLINNINVILKIKNTKW